jgi:hypothetical protein
MLHAPRGELVATWLSIMTTDARLERGQDPAPAAAPEAPPAAAPVPPVRPAAPTVPASPAAPAPSDAPAASRAESPNGKNAGPGGEAADRLAVLGLIIERSAVLEQRVRAAFSELAGSTLAAAAVADQPLGWLIGSCEALADARQELPDPARRAIKDALRGCHAASRRRIDLERSLQAAAGPAGPAGPAGDAGGSGIAAGAGGLNGSSGRSWTTSEISAVGADLRQAGLELATAIRQALRPPAPDSGDRRPAGRLPGGRLPGPGD